MIARDPAGATRVGAGVVTRAVAIVVDVVAIASSFYGGLALGALTFQILRFHRLDVTIVPGVVASMLLLAWTALYFGLGWWLFGKTVGKALLGLRVVRDDGGALGPVRSLVRVLGYALSALVLGLGFAWVAVDRERRAWHDLLARTRVVYDWRPHAGVARGTPSAQSPRVGAGSPAGDDAARTVHARSSTWRVHGSRAVEVAMVGTLYELRVKGDVTGRIEEFVDGAEVTTESVVRAYLPDQAALHGLLAWMESLGLELVDVRPATPNASGDGRT